MMNREDIRNIILSEPKNAHNIIADRLNNEFIWALVVINFVMLVVMIAIGTSVLHLVMK